MQGRKVITFDAAGINFGLSTHWVREVIPASEIHAVAGGPPALRGMINLRQEVLPVFDLQVLFDGPEATTIDKRTCFIVATITTEGSRKLPIALITSRITETYYLEDDDLDSPPVAGSRSLTRCLEGFARTPDGTRMLLAVDSVVRLAYESPDQNASEGGQDAYNEFLQHWASTGDNLLTNLHGNDQVEASGLRQSGNKSLSLQLGTITFAIPLEQIRRIVSQYEVTPDPSAPEGVRGCALIGSQRIPVVDIAPMLGVEQDASSVSKDRSLLVFQIDGTPLAFDVDTVGEIHVSESPTTDTAPPASADAHRCLRQVGFVETNGHTIEVLCFKRAVSTKVLGAIQNWISTIERVDALAALDRDGANDNTTESYPPELELLAGLYLIVRVSDRILALRREDVREVLPHCDLLHPPGAEFDLHGILSLRGATYSVMDVCAHLGFTPKEYPDDKLAIVVLRDKGGRSALLVDRVVGVSRLGPEQLQTPQSGERDVNANLLLAIGKVDSRDVLILNVEELVTDAQPSLLGSWREFCEANPEAKTLVCSAS